MTRFLVLPIPLWSLIIYCQGILDAKAQRKIGLPWSLALANRTCIAVGGTILTAKMALECGLACNTAGGTHHAFPDYGSGFCIFNDLAIASRTLQQSCIIKKILIVDLDVRGFKPKFLVKPDLIFYDAGVDPHIDDKLG